MCTPRQTLVVLLPLLAACAHHAAHQLPGDSTRLNITEVQLVTDEPDAALKILDERAAGRMPSATEWKAVIESEGLRRLQQRERSLNRSLDDTAFRAFLSSDTLLVRLPALHRTLDAWRMLDPSSAARRAFAYLPANATIRARIYPVIKPRTNSFVFETQTNPAIFLYLDPRIDAAQFENTLAHELHHIGVGSVCAQAKTADTTNARVHTVIDWMSGFAEGRAVLAAAGRPDRHPHETSKAPERAVWDRDIRNVATDMRRMERFFGAVLDSSLTDAEVTRRGFVFVNTDSVPQGPFYTLGWLMSVTVERQYGRERLVASLCDPLMFLSDYNRAAVEANRWRSDALPVWSEALLRRLGPTR